MISRYGLIVTVLLPGTAFAQAKLDLETMSVAGGLAKVISLADTCKYTINQEALDRYYKAQKLASPEALGYISGLISMARYSADKTTPSDCTMAKATGKAIGVVAD